MGVKVVHGKIPPPVAGGIARPDIIPTTFPPEILPKIDKFMRPERMPFRFKLDAPKRIYQPVYEWSGAGAAIATAMATVARVKLGTAEILQRIPRAGYEARFKEAFVVKPVHIVAVAQQVKQVQKAKTKQAVAQAQAFAKLIKLPAFHHPPPAKLPLVVPLPNQPPRIVPPPKKARAGRFEPFLRVWPVGKIEKMMWGAPGRRQK
jgi:hypothetical protein